MINCNTTNTNAIKTLHETQRSLALDDSIPLGSEAMALDSVGSEAFVDSEDFVGSEHSVGSAGSEQRGRKRRLVAIMTRGNSPMKRRV
mmetsp:Transcript_9452/g.14966  ORF Transcript_9452/g.14966 Transcript_9452/m.14966 type:complete len:88 (-) Transcript_9452:976-1239(-)